MARQWPLWNETGSDPEKCKLSRGGPARSGTLTMQMMNTDVSLEYKKDGLSGTE